MEFQVYTVGDKGMQTEALSLRAWNEIMSGRPHEAVVSGRTAVAGQREQCSPFPLTENYSDLVLGLVEVGQYKEELYIAQEGVVLATM